MAFSEVFPLETVRKNALQIYQVQLTNWGDVSGSGPNRLASPIFNFSLAGLAIDPESLITSVIVRPVKGGVLNTAGTSQPDDFVIDKERLFTGRMTFPLRAPYNGKWALVAFDGDRYQSSMVGENGVLASLGSSPVLVKPDLRVIMYIDGGPPPAAVPERAPRRVSYTVNAGGNDQSLVIEPISGRKHIRVTCAPLDGPGHVVKFRGITSGGDTAPLRNVEFAALAPDLTTGAVTTPGAVKSQVISNPCCSFIHILTTPNAPAPPINATQVRIDMFD